MLWPEAHPIWLACCFLKADIVKPGVVVQGVLLHIRFILEPPLAHNHILHASTLL